jgi:hypothetical protein
MTDSHINKVCIRFVSNSKCFSSSSSWLKRPSSIRQSRRRVSVALPQKWTTKWNTGYGDMRKTCGVMRVDVIA